MKKIIQYCCFVLLLIYGGKTNAQTTNSGLLSIATNTQWAVTGDYNNNNQELAIELGSASENNLLTASGSIVLSGTVKVNLVNNFAPTAAQTFTIISAASISGTFNSLILPNGYTADIIYNATNVTLSNFRSSLIPITGNLLACNIGTTSRLYIATSGGVWSSSNTSVATINSSGIVTPIANGTTTIKYTYTAGGNANISSTTFTVAVVPTPNAITGATNVCIGGTATLSSTTTGGVWSILNNRASINASSGVLNGLSSGSTVINYTVSNASGCSSYAKCNFAINALPSVPSIQYAAGTPNPQTGSGGAFCANRTFTVVGSPSGGLWSKTGVLIVGTSSGVVNTGTSAGAATLTYTYTDANGCSNSRTTTGNVVVCASKGVNTNQPISQSTNQQFTMYPNPAKSFINLNVETLIGAGTIVITDLYGKQVKAQSLSMGNNIVDIINLSKGIYFVSVIISEGKTTKKLVVE